MKRYLLLQSAFVVAAYPVEVVACGAKVARVRLLHKTPVHRKWHKRGDVLRVKTEHLADKPLKGCWVSEGRGKLVLYREAP